MFYVENNLTVKLVLTEIANEAFDSFQFFVFNLANAQTRDEYQGSKKVGPVFDPEVFFFCYSVVDFRISMLS